MIIEPKIARWAVPFLEPCRYKGAKGGRSGGKSHQFCEMAAEKMAANADFKVAGIREIQKSIKYSLKSLLEQKIYDQKASYLFDMQDQVIKRHDGDGVAIFMGMQDHTADSVKGLEDFDLGLVDEANGLTATSLRKLTPTFRKEGSELWFAWNPDNEEDAIDTFFAENEGHEDFMLIHVNITENPFVSRTGWAEYKREKARAESVAQKDQNALLMFKHVWLGDYNTISDRFVFRNWRKGVIAPPDSVVWFYGADWGFANDPTCALRCCVIGDVLYVDSLVYEVGTPTESLPSLFKGLPDAHKWPMRADSARPETIDYMKRHGYPKMRGAKKGKGSIEAGINFLKGFDIVVHPDCAPLLREFKLYSYKVDKQSGEVLPVIIDANNHAIDALRYAVEGLHKQGTRIVQQETERKRGSYDYGVDDEDEEMDSWKIV